MAGSHVHSVPHEVETNGKEVEAGGEITYLDNCGVYMAASDILGNPTVDM